MVQNQNTVNKAWLEQLFQRYEEGLNGHQDHPVVHFRKAGFKALQATDFPSRRDEDWKYTSVSRILAPDYKKGSATEVSAASIKPFTYPDLKAILLVFVNGILDKSLSDMDILPEGLQLMEVANAAEDTAIYKWMEEQVAQEGGTGKNTFLPLNQAFADQGIFIGVAKKAQIDRPIHLLFVSTTQKEAQFMHPQLFVRAEQSSSVTIIESYESLTEGSYFTNTANWVEVGANANVTQYRLQRESKEAFQVNNTLVRQERDSTYTSYAVDLGGHIVRNNLSTELLASGTQTNYYGIYLGNEEQHIDNQTFIDHAQPHCQSNELYKGILSDKARGVFNGKVMVRQDAQKTNAFQQNSSLVLSPRAVMDAKPQLEIYADDVRCSHGATIGQLDETAVFYLRSRGIPDAEARSLLQQAFLEEVLETMGLDAIQERMSAAIAAKLGA